MQRFFLFSRRCRATATLGVCIGACLAAVFLAGCGPAKDAASLREPSEISSPRADASSVHTACVAMCMEDTALALVTRTGCLEGCEEAWNRFPLRGKTFADRQDCLDALLREERMRENRIAQMKTWCDAKWSHVHNRKGCYLAAERFYAPFSPENICGEAAQSNAPAGSSKTPPARLETPLKPQETPPAITHTVQPAGPLDPPPYVAEPSVAAPENEPKEKKGAEALPEIHDTPKYQKPVPKKTLPAEEKKAAEKNAATKDVPLKKTPEVSAPKGDTPKENIPGENTPGPAAPAAPQAPSSPAPEPAAPATPQAPSSPVPGPAAAPTPQAPPAQGAADTPKTETSTKQPLPPADPGPQAFPEKPESALPEREERPAPGLNANRPVPPEAEQNAQQPGPPARMPPVPSMLNKPYETPTIISPQIDMPGK